MTRAIIQADELILQGLGDNCGDVPAENRRALFVFEKVCPLADGRIEMIDTQYWSSNIPNATNTAPVFWKMGAAFFFKH
jgi:hypothetical protein